MNRRRNPKPTPMRLQQLLHDNAGIQRHYACSNASDSATVWLYDVIGADAWGGISAAQFVQDLSRIQAPVIHLRINSPGGDVFDARAMVTALREHPARIVAHIDGLAASAASYIALAADEVQMSDGAFLMIHNAWGIVLGNRHDLLEMAMTLEKVDQSIAADYQRKTGQEAERIQQWMDNETWFTAQEALDAGFVEHIAAADRPHQNQQWNLAAFGRPAARALHHSEADRSRRLAVIESTA